MPDGSFRKRNGRQGPAVSCRFTDAFEEQSATHAGSVAKRNRPRPRNDDDSKSARCCRCENRSRRCFTRGSQKPIQNLQMKSWKQFSRTLQGPPTRRSVRGVNDLDKHFSAGQPRSRLSDATYSHRARMRYRRLLTISETAVTCARIVELIERSNICWTNQKARHS